PDLPQLPGRGLLDGLGLLDRVVPGDHVHQVVLDVLLGEGGTALGDLPRGLVGDGGAHGAGPVDAVVVEEPAVFDGDDRRLHGVGDLVWGGWRAVLGVQVGDRVPVHVRDRGHVRGVLGDHLRGGGVHRVAGAVGDHAQ